ncbi:MAG: protein kinase domain-containing protein [Planctomycetaceae bacterium]
MPAATKLTPEMFVGLARQSGLIEGETLRLALREIPFDAKNVADTPQVADFLVERQLLTRWQADKLLQGRNKGFLLGKYRLLSHLGTGGMSAVYLAEHRLMRRRVAIKVLPKASARGASHLERFHKEAQAVAALDHRNIVRAYDVDQEGDIHFLVMEYVSGRSLQDIVASEGPFQPIPAAEYIRQAAEGLNQAHKSNLVHRDIKPANLLLDDRGTIKVLDLGLVRFFDERDDSSITRRHDEKVLGTADYLSPEQALDSHSVDVRSDVYSLGCTFFFLLAGHPPFSEGTLAARLLAHQTKEPPSLAEIAPQGPPGLVALVRRLMAKRPEDRFQSARDVAQVLADWLRENGGDIWAEMHPVVGGAVAGLTYGSSPVGGEAGWTTGSSTAPPSKTIEAPRSSSGTDWSPRQGWPAETPSVVAGTLLPPPELAPVRPSQVTPPVIDNRAGPGIGPDEEESPEFAAFLRRTSEADQAAGGRAQVQPVAPSSAPLPESIPATPQGESPPPFLPGAPATVPGADDRSSAAAAPPQVSPPLQSSGSDDALGDTRVLSAPAAPTSSPDSPPQDSGQQSKVTVPPLAGEPVAVAPVPVAPVSLAPVPLEPVPTQPPPLSTAPVEFSSLPAAEEELLVDFADGSRAEASHETLVMPSVKAQPQSPPVPLPGSLPPSPSPPVESGPEPAPTWIVETERPVRRAARSAVRATPGPPRAAQKEASVSSPRSPGASPESRRRLWWIVGANALLTLLTLGIWFTWGPGKSKPSQGSSKTGSADRNSAGKSKGAGRKKGTAKAPDDDTASSGPTISASRRELRVGPSDSYKSLAAALAEAKNFRPSSRSARQTITLPPGVLAERITVDQTWPRGLIIKGQGTVLAPAGAEPVVSVIASQGDLPNFQLEGVEIDASGKETAIRLGGNLEASRFVDLTIHGFAREAVALEGVQSFGGVPVIFERLTIRGAAQSTAVGFELTRRGEQGNNRIRLRGCRLLGPLAAGIRARDDALDLEVEETIFHQAKIGLHLQGTNPNWRNLLLASNTFYQVGQGVVFDNMPGSATDGLSFFNNLFVESAERDAIVAQGFNEAVFLQMFASNPGGIDFNWTTRPAANPPVPNEIPSLFVARSGRYGVQPQFVSVDPASDDFLRPAPGSPQGNVGQAEALFPKKRFGNQIGAVRPR